MFALSPPRRSNRRGQAAASRRAALAFILVAGLQAICARPAEARRVHGAQIPDPSDPVPGQANHFTIRRSLERALRDIKRTYERVPGVVIRRVSTPPGVEAYYVENTRPGRAWDGINLYEVRATKSVYVSVLPAQHSEGNR